MAAEGEVEETEVLTDRALSESIDASMRDTLREIQSRPENQVEEPAPVVTEKAAEPADKPRAPDGKFVKGEQKRHNAAPKESAAPATTDTPEKPIAAPVTEQAAADTEVLKFGKVEVDLTRPPSSWKPAAKAAWAALPPDVQKEIYRRETDFSNTVLGGPLKENANFGQAVRGVVEPYRTMIEAEGGTPEKAIGDLLKTAALFRTAPQPTKLNALFQLDQQFGAGLREHFQQTVAAEVARQTGQPAPQGQPQAQPLADPRVDQLIEGMQRQERERTEREQRVAMETVQAFWNEKDAGGQPLYPFIENVLDDMTARVQQLRRQNPAMDHAQALKAAYDAAVWANPETREVLMAAKQAQAAAPAETLRKVQAARAASAVNVPKRGAIPASESVGHLRLGTPESDASIRETFRQLQAQ